MTSQPSSQAIRARHADDWYVAYHAPRYAELLALVDQLPIGPEDRVLDVGRSALTDLIAEQLGRPVDSLGFAADGPTATGDHYEFDLNSAQHTERWRRDLPTYRVIVLAEVIEHVHTAPSLVLGFLRGLLQDDGYLVVQTPNAVALTRRLKILVGRNPYSLITEDEKSPAHFREYTRKELHWYAARSGFSVQATELRSYFDMRYRDNRRPTGAERMRGTLQNVVYRLLPPSMRTGITLVLQPSRDA